MIIVVIIFGILWIVKGEIPVTRNRKISAENGRTLGWLMVIGGVILFCAPLPLGLAATLAVILAILPIVLGLALAEHIYD